MTATLTVCSLALAALACAGAAPLGAQRTETLMLSGTDHEHTVPWEFRISGGMNAGRWSTIPVPSNWELQKFGTYSYGRDVESPDVGEYRHRFRVPAAWRGRAVRIVFEGAMTDTDVRLNGVPAGPTHQGGYYRFRYDVTGLLKYGEENVLEATVREHSADTSVNRAERQADFWLFGGIFRPVYLEALPASHVDRVAIDARADGALRIDAFLGGRALPAGTRVTAQATTLDGGPLGAPMTAVVPAGAWGAPAAEAPPVTLRGRVAGVRPWSAEFPHRYRVRVTLLAPGGGAVHAVTETIGFRTVEVRPRDGIYVNGVRVRLKGVNRHTFWPTSGRTTSRAISVADVQLMKDMNMNAVRMSHYPPDTHFLDVTDSLGLFVLDELTGWQKAYDTAVGEKLVRETVTRDVNHPSVILWDNGNEGGWNFALDDDFAKYDPQRRVVLHPWALHGGVHTAHYRGTWCCAGRVFEGRDLVMPTEIQHGLYDGGHGAGLADYWADMLANPRGAGLFLWDFTDQGVLRTDLPGDTLDTWGNQGADGIVGPRREKEGSFWAIKEIWSPVHLELGATDALPPTFDGRLLVENRYHYTNLRQVAFAWELVRFPGPAERAAGHTVVRRGSLGGPDVAPEMRGVLALHLPADWGRHDALRLRATDPHGREIYTWTWMIATPERVAARTTSAAGVGRATGEATADRVAVRAGEVLAEFERATGRLVRLARGDRTLPLTNGPRLVGGTEGRLTALTHAADGDDYVVEATYAGALRYARWRVRPNGWLSLDYRYELDGEVDAAGITFDLPDARVDGMRWLGRGPYRVWKNRPEGVEFDVWRKAYNDAVTGLVWQYPEFKGFHADLHWAVLETAPLPLTVVTPSEDLFLRVLTPRVPPTADRKMTPAGTALEFPPGDLSFLHAIPPIGNKFMAPERVSPSGRRNVVQRSAPNSSERDYTASVWLYVGEPPAAATQP